MNRWLNQLTILIFSTVLVLPVAGVLGIFGPSVNAQSCTHTPCPGFSACADFQTATCFDGTWPDGQIYYDFTNVAVADRKWIRQVMNDWETVANGLIRFVKSTTATPRVIVFNDGGGSGAGYNGCVANPPACQVHLGKGNAYHEIGHTTGLIHAFQRYERRHYLFINNTDCIMDSGGCSAAGYRRCSTPTDSNNVDIGPFDYKSALMYAAAYPDFSRYNTSFGICDNQNSCSTGATCPGVAPPGCPGGIRCPTTPADVYSNQPYGYPSRGDGAAVVELYLSARDPAWGKFRRTVEEDVGTGLNTPYVYNLAPGVRIPAKSSPAMETWEGNTLSVYVRGSDGAIYQKSKNPVTGLWSDAAVNLGKPGTTGATTDPAAVSWGSGRTDIVVRRGGTIYIKTYNGSWGTWQSLGAPASVPASAPAITSIGPNTLYVFVRGTNNKLYMRKCTGSCVGNTGTWTVWGVAAPSGTFKGKPAVISRQPGAEIIEVCVHGMADDSIYCNAYLDGVWNQTWTLVDNGGTAKWDPNCPDCSSPALGARDIYTFDLYIRGGDDQVYIATYTPGSGWSTFSPLGGVLSSSPGTVTRSRTAGRIDLAVTTPEERRPGRFSRGVWVKQYNP